MLDLKNVTLVSVDSAQDYTQKSNIRLSVISRVVPNILKKINFGDVLMINPFGKNSHYLKYKFDMLWPPSGNWDETRQIFQLNMPSYENYWYSSFFIQILPFLIKTEYYLTINWDGFPLRPDLWSDNFFEFDYIGGGDINGMNGGFSLRRTDTMQKIAYLNNRYDAKSEDMLIQRFYSPQTVTPFKINNFYYHKNENIESAKSAIHKFSHFNSRQLNEENMIQSFGFHLSEHLSSQSLYKALSLIDEFSKEESDSIVNHYMMRLMHNNPCSFNSLNHINIACNESFFENY